MFVNTILCRPVRQLLALPFAVPPRLAQTLWMSRALVYGGSGALGRAIVSRFRSANWHVISLDFSENPEASANIVLSLPGRAPSLADSGETVTARVAEALGNHKLDAILTVAGGWAGGNLADSSLFANTDAMISQSIHSSVIAARLAALHLKEYIAYGLAKAAVHQLVKSASGPNSGLPAGAKVTAITLDTPMNRKFMPDADTSTWTPMDFVANKFLSWADGTEPVESGSLLRLVTADHKTELVPVI
ncbi:hypothetical protein HK105_204662 [Polyrhizophydium stewartii]|uniref:NAD-dependent epimerase/dehydratase domain-containing protein n=1 Tax=Polyrhizophydium stewartii TaxID=2732419 RepID=A0ABR4N855_9FUNG